MKKIALLALAILILFLLVLLAAPFYLDAENLEITAEVRAQAPGNFVELTDGFTHYDLTGPDTGQAVLLVHGATVPYYVWDSTYTALAEAGFRVLRYDMYGRGLSGRPDVVYDRELFERQILELSEALRIRPPMDLVGLSLGGAVVAGFAARYPERVGRLVFIAPVYEAIDAELLRTPLIGEYVAAAFLAPSLPQRQLLDFHEPERFPDWPERYREQMQYHGFRRAILSTLRHYAAWDKLPLYESVSNLDKPVLLIWGREDKVVPFAGSEALQRVLSAEFLEVEEAGHLPQLERPEVVNLALIDFLRQ